MLITPYIAKFHADTLAKGGATVDLTKHNLREPEERYYVGNGKHSWVHKVRVEKGTPTYLAMIVAVAKAEGWFTIGTWVQNGLVYIEPTLLFAAEDDARRVAVALGEHAFFDSETRETIYVWH